MSREIKFRGRRRGPRKDSIGGFINGTHKNLPPEIFFKYVFKPPIRNGFNKVQFPMVNSRFV